MQRQAVARDVAPMAAFFEDTLLTINECADRLKVSKKTVHNFICREKTLVAMRMNAPKVGRGRSTYRIRRSELERFINAMTINAPTRVM